MQGFKVTILAVLAILAIGILGWWAVRTIEPGDVHAEREKQRALAERNQELEKEVERLKEELALYKPAEPAEVESEEEVGLEEEPPPEASLKYETLIAELQDLIDDKVTMKVGSKGTRVGTVQTFLNIYFNTNKKIDNDYGNGMKTDVANFQKAQGLPVTGQASTQTFTKMIEWLRNNS